MSDSSVTTGKRFKNNNRFKVLSKFYTAVPRTAKTDIVYTHDSQLSRNLRFLALERVNLVGES